jgi:hypothetical protein
MFNPLKRSFVSDIGSFLAKFDQSHPKKSVSQEKEIAKHARIAALRDSTLSTTAEPLSVDKKIWEGF